jgi:P-aminobenzoate N-oxygenase AurF
VTAPSSPGPASGPFEHWYDHAGVRGGHRRRFVDETDQGKVFFPAHLVPYLDHPAVAALPEPERVALTVRHLYQFLQATTHVETRVVNRTAERIANGRSGVELSTADRMDAFKIYCDEGYHALYSLDLADQIAATTGTPVPNLDYGTFVDRLASTAHELLPGEADLAQMLQVVVFETLITAVLNELPADATVVTTVRDVMRDHARDEGRHHRFFTQFFHRLWAQLDATHRGRVAHALPTMIEQCLQADLYPVRASLALASLDANRVEWVVGDCYQGGAGAARTREITRATVKMCQSAGVFEIPGAEERFAAFGLAPE